MESRDALNLVKSIESSNVEQMAYFVRGLQRRSRALINGREVVRRLHRPQERFYSVLCSRGGRLFEGSIGIRGGSIVYFV